MHKYHHVALAVEPKKVQLAQAQAELEETRATLADAKGRLKEVMDRIQTLEQNYERGNNKKLSLEQEVETCKVRLESAMKLINATNASLFRTTLFSIYMLDMIQFAVYVNFALILPKK